MTMPQLQLVKLYNSRGLDKNNTPTKFASCKPCYIFMKCSGICNNDYLIMCLFTILNLYFIEWGPRVNLVWRASSCSHKHINKLKGFLTEQNSAKSFTYKIQLEKYNSSMLNYEWEEDNLKIENSLHTGVIAR